MKVKKGYTLYPSIVRVLSNFEKLRGIPMTASVVFVIHSAPEEVKVKTEILTWTLGESLKDFTTEMMRVINAHRHRLNEGLFVIQDGICELFAVGGYPTDEFTRNTASMVGFFNEVGKTGFLTPKRSQNELLADRKSEAGEATETGTASQEAG